LRHGWELKNKIITVFLSGSLPLHQDGKKLDELKPWFNQEDVPDNVKDLFRAPSFTSFADKSLLKKEKL